MDATQATQATQVVQGLDWTQALTVFVIMATNFGTLIGLYIHTDKKIEEGRKETNEIIKTVHEEMKQFNESMRQEMNQFHNAMLQFHGRVCAIEERNKK